MGNVYIFRGMAGVGKTTLAGMLAAQLRIPLLCKDHIVEGAKMSQKIVDRTILNNVLYYDIFYKLVQTNLNLGADMVLDIALGDRSHAQMFFDRLDFGSNSRLDFFVICSSENEWRERHEARLLNPTLSQSFKSFEHVKQHYAERDINPFEYEYVIDTIKTAEESFAEIMRVVEG